MGITRQVNKQKKTNKKNSYKHRPTDIAYLDVAARRRRPAEHGDGGLGPDAVQGLLPTVEGHGPCFVGFGLLNFVGFVLVDLVVLVLWIFWGGRLVGVLSCLCIHIHIHMWNNEGLRTDPLGVPLAGVVRVGDLFPDEFGEGKRTVSEEEEKRG